MEVSRNVLQSISAEAVSCGEEKLENEPLENELVELSQERKVDKKRKRRTQVVGGAFLFLGVPGLFLPLLQGVLLIAIGVCILSLESMWLAEKIDALAARFPRLGLTITKARMVAQKWFAL